MDLSNLASEFPKAAIHWRAQTLTKNGDKALALAYLDARDVMDRLDEVCGPAGWQSRYTETAKGRVLCEIGIHIEGEWVWKSDGAGDTAVEGEKGGISDAFKRAAVHWGIGRYLYRLDAVWCPCETYNGKWRKWTDDPWNYVRKGSNKPAPEQFDAAGTRDRIKKAIAAAQDAQSVSKVWDHPKTAEAVGKLHPAMQAELNKAYTDRMAAVYQAPEAAE